MKIELNQSSPVLYVYISDLLSGGYFGCATALGEIFGVNALKGKLLRGSFSGTEISLILKNKMAAVGMSLKIIQFF